MNSDSHVEAWIKRMADFLRRQLAVSRQVQRSDPHTFGRRPRIAPARQPRI